MARQATGNTFKSSGSWYARVSTGDGRRQAIQLRACSNESEARYRTELMARLVGELRQANREDFIPVVLEKVATLSSTELKIFERLARGYASGAEVRVSSVSGKEITFGQFAQRWTSGELAREFPAHVKVKRSSGDDEYRLKKWVYPLLKDVPLTQVGVDHYDAILCSVGSERSSATRRHVAQVVSRVLALAVYPARLIPSNPIPRGALPNRDAPRARTYLYPEEDRVLLQCCQVPIVNRVLYGFLAREGMRVGEAVGLTWALLDLDLGIVRVEVTNKCDDYRARSLDDGVVRALRAWYRYLGRPALDTPVFAIDGRICDHRADVFRKHLEVAKVKREDLHTSTSRRQRIRVHDLRATFVTISLAAGRSETWVADRTGHQSSAQMKADPV